MSRKNFTNRPGRKSEDLVNNAVENVRNDYASTNVTTGAWVELISSTSDDIDRLDIYDTGGETLELGIGAAASEQRLVLINPGGSEGTLIHIDKGTRVSVRAVSGNVTSGELIINAYN